jgi:molybdenum cofactor synthesis domain-containing protein
MSRAHVITVSDRAAAGQMEDASGPAVAAALGGAGFEVGSVEVVPDDRARIAAAISGAAGAGCRLVVTTGGTGLGPRDVTPQATATVLEYQVPGLAEAMRHQGLARTPLAALSRGLAGVGGGALIINLPGSVKGAIESLAAVLPALPHAVQLLEGDTAH